MFLCQGGVQYNVVPNEMTACKLSSFFSALGIFCTIVFDWSIIDFCHFSSILCVYVDEGKLNFISIANSMMCC